MLNIKYKEDEVFEWGTIEHLDFRKLMNEEEPQHECLTIIQDEKKNFCILYSNEPLHEENTIYPSNQLKDNNINEDWGDVSKEQIENNKNIFARHGRKFLISKDSENLIEYLEFLNNRVEYIKLDDEIFFDEELYNIRIEELQKAEDNSNGWN